MKRLGQIFLMIVVVIVLVGGLILTSCVPEEETPTPSPLASLLLPFWNPSTIPTNTPTPVRIYVAFIDPDYVPIPESVTLWRDSTILGTFHDDGTSGDPVAGDSIYTIIPIFSESAQTTITLQLSVQFIGVPEEIFSDSFSIEVSEEAIICAESETVTLGTDGSFKLPDLTGTTPDKPGVILLNQGIFPNGANVTQDPPPGTVFTALGSVDITFMAVHAETVAQCIMTLSVVDAIPPEIIVEGIESGDVFADCVTPTISVSDNLDPPETIELQLLLNGEDYMPGTLICEPGEYTLSVIAADGSGNSAESQIVFGIVDTNKTKGAAMVVVDLHFEEMVEGVSMNVTVLLASNQFDVFEIDGYSVMLHVCGPQGEVLDQQPIRVAGSVGDDGLYSPLIAQSWFWFGFWVLTFEAELPDYPYSFLITGSAFEGEVDWVAGALLEPPDPILPVVTLAPLNVPLAPAEPNPEHLESLDYAGLVDWEDPREQVGFTGTNATCNCKWKHRDDLKPVGVASQMPPSISFPFCVQQKKMYIMANGGYIFGDAAAIDTWAIDCVGCVDDTASVKGGRTIEVWLEGPPNCCDCEITLKADPQFTAEANLNPPGIAVAGGKIEVGGTHLSVTAEGAVVSGTTTNSIGVTVGAAGFTGLVYSGEGKQMMIISGKPAAEVLTKCEKVIIEVTGTGWLKVMADADFWDRYAEAKANLRHPMLNISIEAKCTAKKDECRCTSPNPFIYKLR